MKAISPIPGRAFWLSCSLAILKAGLFLAMAGLFRLGGPPASLAQSITLAVPQAIPSPPPISNSFLLSWNSTQGTYYNLQMRTNLVEGSWSNLVGLTASGSISQWLDVYPPDDARFYRVVLGPAITQVTPSIIVAGSGPTLGFTGQRLSAGEMIEVGGVLVSNLVFDNTTLFSGLPPNLAPGTYNVSLYNSNGVALSILSNALQVIAFSPPESPLAKPCDCSDAGGEDSSPAPLYLYSGEFRHAAVDMRIKGRGLDFIWGRKYRSQSGPNTPQGNRWDFSYNIWVQPDGTNILVLHDGNAREDLYLNNGLGVYSCPGFFRELTGATNTGYTLTFPDEGAWRFLPMDGSPSQGKITSISDRNGNSLTFDYDSVAGLLTNVVDTLGRSISITYASGANISNLISSVTDFTGRQVTYTYYQTNSGSGNPDDLFQVTSPAVTGTPNTNNFPSGKTTTYTYSYGSTNDVLNHNLLTISAPNGLWLENFYSTDPVSTNLDFNRVTQQTWGGKTLTYTYEILSPTNTNYFASQKTIVNDRVGNVKEYFYDASDRMVMLNEYTGRAVVGQPVTDTSNRPTNQVRATDPAYFQTLYQFNSDFLPTQITYPNSNATFFSYAAGSSPRTHGNLQAKSMVPGPLGGDQTSLTMQYSYDTDGGGSGFNVVVQDIDARGNTNTYSYDGHGNLIHRVGRIPSIIDDFTYNAAGQMTSHTLPDNGNGSRRMDAFTYYGTNDFQYGYLSNSIIDATNLMLTTTYQYDQRGNVTRTIDPRGNDSSNIVNQLDQVVQTLSRTVTTPAGPVRYVRSIFYDGNNNVNKISAFNVNDQGVPEPSFPSYNTTSSYDALNYPIVTTQDGGASPSFTISMSYDGNRNVTNKVTGGIVVAYTYDERDLLFHSIHAPGNPGVRSTSESDYDLNGNLILAIQGLEDTNAPHITTFGYDGFNRQVAGTNAIGTVTTKNYDANGNLVHSLTTGYLAATNGMGQTNRLSEMFFAYDAMDRQTQSTNAFFDTQSQNAIGSGFTVTITTYNNNSQILTVIDPNLHSTTNLYDSAYRISTVTDAKGNSRTMAYDQNGNVTNVVELDKSDRGNPAQTYSTTNSFDQMDRLIQMIDNAGQTNSYAYDSLNNRTLAISARSNQIRWVYDGLNRVISTVQFLTPTGDGTSATNGAIVTSQTWSSAGRINSQTDPNTNKTTYFYDAQNRPTQTTFADATSVVINSYDVHDNVLKMTDGNSTKTTNTYDVANRLTSKTIAPGTKVTGTTSEFYAYDGLSRMIFGTNYFNTTNGSVVSRRYDSLSHVTYDGQQLLPGGPLRVTTSTYDGVGNQIACTYPGGRQITNAFDSLNRVSLVSDNLFGQIAAFFYLGPARVEYRGYGNGTSCNYLYDNLRRITNLAQNSLSASIDLRGFGWDPDDNKTARADLRFGGPQLFHLYTNDSANRLVAGQINQFGNSVALTDYSLDGAGNRTNAPYSLTGSTVNPKSASVNEYTVTPFDSRNYDSDGNLVVRSNVSSVWNYYYDYRNLLVQATNSPGTETTLYTYDVLGRRIQKSVNGQVTGYLYSGWQELEEEDTNGNTLATYVYGKDIDEALTMQRGGTNYFYHTDDLGNVMALTDSSGNVVERYEYDDYGQPLNPTNLTAIASPANPSSVGNPLLFNSRRYDVETGLYYYRTRNLDPLTGRFLTRDSIGIWEDESNRGNGYIYAGSGPLTRIDPMGLDDEIKVYGTFKKWGDWNFGDVFAFALFGEKGGYGVPFHVFYEQDGRGFGRFGPNKQNGATMRPWCPAKIRSDDLDTYPEEEKTPPGLYFRKVIGVIKIDTEKYDVDRFNASLREYRANQEKNPGTYVPLIRDCSSFTSDSLEYAAINSIRGAPPISGMPSNDDAPIWKLWRAITGDSAEPMPTPVIIDKNKKIVAEKKALPAQAAAYEAARRQSWIDAGIPSPGEGWYPGNELRGKAMKSAERERIIQGYHDRMNPK